MDNFITALRCADDGELFLVRRLRSVRLHVVMQACLLSLLDAKAGASPYDPIACEN